MIINSIHIKGFRNYKDTIIRFCEKNLIIGANDVGKTNLLYALRLLFDKSLSERDLELVEGDYYAYEETTTVQITVYIEQITEDCLISAFGGNLIEGKTVIRYLNDRNGSYKILLGGTDELLEEQPGRTYIKYLNMQYVDTNRDLYSFMKRERNQMLSMSKSLLSDEELKHDEEIFSNIQSGLDTVNSKINQMYHIERALMSVNSELETMSSRNEGMKIRFVAGQSDAGKLLDNLSLAYLNDDRLLTVGGDGRNNQVFISTWVAKQNIEKAVDHVTFYAIEEPEAHLHPHQQRKLSEYIQNQFEEQVFISSHSPLIAMEFNPSNIIRLYNNSKYTEAACGGASSIIKDRVDELGHRLNAISAETFFSDGVFLVEGTSETILFNALAKKNGIDLDRNNISILSVEGIGFKPYIATCVALNIPFVMRTDNDVFSKKINHTEYEYYAGVSRAVSIAEMLKGSDEILEFWEDNKEKNEWETGAYTASNSEFNYMMKEKLESIGIYLSHVDLESDLVNSELKNSLALYYETDDNSALIKIMQQRKAENMFSYIAQHIDDLSVLGANEIITPLMKLLEKVAG